MQKDDYVRLRHMLDAAREAFSFVQNKIRNDLDTDRKLVLALVKDVEIVGEAAAKSTIDQLINSPYEEPNHYWGYDRERRLFELKDGWRPAGYVVASEGSRAFDDPGIFMRHP